MVCQACSRLEYLEFVQSKNDCSMFIKHNGSLTTIVAVYVDGIVLTGDDVESIAALEVHLHVAFSIKDPGKLHFFLSIEVLYIPDGIFIT